MAFNVNPRILSTVGGGVPPIINIKEADSQTFKKGQLVYDAGSSANGAATVVAEDGTTIMGIAQADGTNVTSAHTTIPIEVIQPGDRVAIQCYDKSDAAAKAASNFLKGKGYGLITASNVTYVDFDETTSDAVIFIEPLDSTNYANWGIFQFISSVLQPFAKQV
jgi:hypothetical protein